MFYLMGPFEYRGPGAHVKTIRFGKFQVKSTPWQDRGGHPESNRYTGADFLKLV